MCATWLVLGDEQTNVREILNYLYSDQN
jgi:hypothetical protein